MMKEKEKIAACPAYIFLTKHDTEFPQKQK